MISKRKQYGAALLAMLEDERQMDANNLGKAKASALPEGRRWVTHKEPTGDAPTGLVSGCDSHDTKSE